MNITILGHVCIDTNSAEHTSYTSAGSPAIFMNKVYRQFPGVKSQIIAPYGADFLPYLKGIPIYPNKPSEKKTLLYKNIMHGNIRIQKAINREYVELLPITDEMQDIISQSDVIYLAPLTAGYSIQYVHYLMQFAHKDALKILLPQGYYRSFDSENTVHQREFKEADILLPLFDFVIVSEQDHFVMNEYSKKWAQNIRVIVTEGEKGAHYFYKNESTLVPTKPVRPEDIIDSVGSGDIFSASFGYTYFKTKDVHASIEFANNIARQCLFYKADSLKITLP